ncbi:hypothetical protein OSC52_16765 [Clostridium pasteurianum]|uniref:hypothetical protein n=1 Tax=Clostridium pasteurianum TaxID=1501 RepID=UPI002260CF55|nr:hypothetical protein [Clostridium pasteurianum]UZW13475.1 hypothetical protein OSC52_16765 [Clostridium pasteurianum]
MKKEDIKKSFDNLTPSDNAKQRMLNNILEHSYNNRKLINIKIAIPVLVIAIIFVGALTVHNSNKETARIMRGGTVNGPKMPINDNSARITNQFKIENKTYNILSESEKKEFKFPETIDKKDIGHKITTVTNSIDGNLNGKEVYSYLPAGCEAVVAVKENDSYKLFKFFNFDSYMENEDEDVKAYLELYGINKEEDISKIQFLNYHEETVPTKDEKQGTAAVPEKSNIISEITDRNKITKFYNYYSPIKNSSKDYFNKLFDYKDVNKHTEIINNKAKTLSPDYKDNSSSDNTAISSSQSRSNADNGEVKDVPSSTPGSEGAAANALSNSVTIRIYNNSGVYSDSEYYPNIGFISRHEVSDEFEKFLKDYIK